MRPIQTHGHHRRLEPAGGGYAEYVRVMSFVLPGVVKIRPKFI